MAARKSTRRTSTDSKPSGGNAEKYEQIAQRFIDALERGTVPWRQPWIAGGLPTSMATGKAYRGVNVWLLALTSMEKGYTSPFWGTYDQVAKQAGMEQREGRNGHKFWVSPDGTERGVTRGEKGTFVTLWKELRIVEPDETGQPVAKVVPMLRFFYVFNADQCQGLPAKFYPTAQATDTEPIAAIDNILTAYLANGGPHFFEDETARATYNHMTDEVHMPPVTAHISAAEYASTKAHELVHSTGHHSRLARREDGEKRAFGSHDYGREELTAELGAAWLLALAGVETPDTFTNSAAYLASWIRAIKESPKIIVQAASAAQKAVDLIMPPEGDAQEACETAPELATV